MGVGSVFGTSAVSPADVIWEAEVLCHIADSASYTNSSTHALLIFCDAPLGFIYSVDSMRVPSTCVHDRVFAQTRRHERQKDSQPETICQAVWVLQANAGKQDTMIASRWRGSLGLHAWERGLGAYSTVATWRRKHQITTVHSKQKKRRADDYSFGAQQVPSWPTVAATLGC
jgi:hypothetical protein